jgi:uncharacterized protein (TIGR03663 family)
MKRSKENRKSIAFQSTIRSTVWLWPILLIASFFRLHHLGVKPPHFDEGINGHFVLTLWRDGFYTYDPSNFHGPIYFYLLQLAEILFGRGIESFRTLNAFLSIGLVAMIFQFRRFVGSAAVWASAMIAISPAFTFYGRYAIHETLFIIGQVAFVFGRLIWMQRPGRDSVYFMASGLVIMLATKETFIIFLGTWVIAEVVVNYSERLNLWIRRKRTQVVSDENLNPWTRTDELSPLEIKNLVTAVWLGLGISVFVLLALFTGFFENPKGAGDFFRAFDFWTNTGKAGNGHSKEATYWALTMWRYEWLLLIGLMAGAATAFPFQWINRAQRILVLSGFGNFLAYSLIPYKTPWLILSFWGLFFFLFPVLRKGVRYGIVILFLLVGFIHDSNQAYRLNFRNFTDPTEPYVYVQTTQDYAKILNVFERQVQLSPAAKNFVFLVLVQDPWPLPYDLALLPNLKYLKLAELDRNLGLLKEADVILIDGDQLEGLRKVMPKKFGRVKFQLRDAYQSGWALFDFEKFQLVLPGDAEIEERIK